MYPSFKKNQLETTEANHVNVREHMDFFGRNEKKWFNLNQFLRHTYVHYTYTTRNAQTNLERSKMKNRYESPAAYWLKSTRNEIRK